VTKQEFVKLVYRAQEGDGIAARQLRAYADRAHGPSGATVRDARAVCGSRVPPPPAGTTSTIRRATTSGAELKAKARRAARRH
jgi:hypothetical protein